VESETDVLECGLPETELPTEAEGDRPLERVQWPTPDSSITSARALQADGILAETLQWSIGELREAGRESASALQASVDRNTDTLAALIRLMEEQNRLLTRWTDQQTNRLTRDDVTAKQTTDNPTDQQTDRLTIRQYCLVSRL
jgi:hypothetical protein